MWSGCGHNSFTWQSREELVYIVNLNKDHNKSKSIKSMELVVVEQNKRMELEVKQLKRRHYYTTACLIQHNLSN